MTEYWFYHLEAAPLEAVLPELLAKTQDKGWKTLVCLPESEMAAMDDYLWTYRDDAFLPHGRDDEPLADQQPILLSAHAASSAAMDCAVLVDSYDVDIAETTQRCIVMINGRSDAGVAAARGFWKRLSDSGAELSYWQQDERGRWSKKA